MTNRPPAFAILSPWTRHTRVVGALMMRELITRYGRRGLGFVWLIGEPLLFCLGVLVLWSVIRPDYEHGVRLGPFVMTGYMALLLFRHQIGFSLAALQSNIGLLHHRAVTALHIYASRNLLEFLGATGAFVVVYAILMTLGQVSLPHDWLLLYFGWIVLGLMGMGLALTLSGLAVRFEVMERIVPLLTYALIPLSGVFFMADWLPPAYREMFLLIPLPHPVEMIRAGVFGEFVVTHYDPVYALAWCGILNLLGLALLNGAKDRVDAE
ncbi:ABC transporter permease [Brevundimonas sp.]|uniref:ABC transporter permease n=1 Tax=Brevundimonas sp. TaxID=1871086 RepID=UPI002AB83A7E|nr:ABC transporter permease [Brevundimonas sp.]MDZ4362852.1 ABC transporter permease [Brevundimonas sp.]